MFENFGMTKKIWDEKFWDGAEYRYGQRFDALCLEGLLKMITYPTSFAQ